MNLQYLCTNCLNGTLQNGICTSCRKHAGETAPRKANTLPDRYMLGSRYYLGRVIGKGRFGITYMAWDCERGERVIVKELYPDQDVVRDPHTGRVIPIQGQEACFQKYKQRFKEEALTLYSFQREPTILNVYGLLEANGTVYYSMEYLSGWDMKTFILNQGKMAWSQLSFYVRDILRTLHVIHAKNLIHRDITPDNIFLISDRNAKLIDFGSVRCYNDGTGLTALVKAVFAPPEQYYTNGNQGPWTDIYSLCVTMYYALSGICPPKAPDRISRDGTVPLGQLCSGLPGHVETAVWKGMSIRIEDRYPDIKAFAAALFPGEDIFSSLWTTNSSNVPGSVKKISRSKQQEFIGKVKQRFEAAKVKQTACYFLRGISGRYQGRVIPVTADSLLVFGRSSQCHVAYPADTRGVSRKHLTIWCDRSKNLFIMDEHSSCGTMVSGYRLQPGMWYRLQKGNTVNFAGEGFYVE
ncbi:MAG: FHA domain-containing serine/threonine-protein kinase [Lachnospiraceae bacterium]|nr:FHA domain-containing serine/threonine-protein kinase [Lachnospiraceae bacterium]